LTESDISDILNKELPFAGNRHYLQANTINRKKAEMTNLQGFDETQGTNNYLRKDSNELPENGNELPKEPLSKKEFANAFGYNPDVVSKGLRSLKEVHDEEDLYSGSKLSVFCQKEFLKLKQLGKQKYKESVLKEGAKRNENEETTGTLAKMENENLPEFRETQTTVDLDTVNPTVLVETFSTRAAQIKGQTDKNRKDSSILDENIKKLEEMERRIKEEQAKMRGTYQYWQEKKLEKEAYMQEKQKDLGKQLEE